MSDLLVTSLGRQEREQADQQQAQASECTSTTTATRGRGRGWSCHTGGHGSAVIGGIGIRLAGAHRGGVLNTARGGGGDGD